MLTTASDTAWFSTASTSSCQQGGSQHRGAGGHREDPGAPGTHGAGSASSRAAARGEGAAGADPAAVNPGDRGVCRRWVSRRAGWVCAGGQVRGGEGGFRRCQQVPLQVPLRSAGGFRRPRLAGKTCRRQARAHHGARSAKCTGVQSAFEVPIRAHRRRRDPRQDRLEVKARMHQHERRPRPARPLVEGEQRARDAEVSSDPCETGGVKSCIDRDRARCETKAVTEEGEDEGRQQAPRHPGDGGSVRSRFL
jgi:hypothetical protein